MSGGLGSGRGCRVPLGAAGPRRRRHQRAVTTAPRTVSLFCTALRARWAGESVNSLLPAGQIGGPMLMVPYLAHHGTRVRDAAAAIHRQHDEPGALAQHALRADRHLLLSGAAGNLSRPALTPIIAVTVVIGLCVLWSSVSSPQRRGLFGRVMRLARRRDFRQAHLGRPGAACRCRGCRRARPVPRAPQGGRRASGWNLTGWIVGTGEVWLLHYFSGSSTWAGTRPCCWKA